MTVNQKVFLKERSLNDFAKNLIREKPADLNVPIPVVEAFNSQEIITFCQTAGYEYELISWTLDKKKFIRESHSRINFFLSKVQNPLLPLALRYLGLLA
ncbi:DUF3110 domain-containing protein [Desmonostoc muscorum LEGE 12446]|uniref:DUF3110 domain-containing protein n=1 Tax=Desmonostoc muscorum LEGE 12446 TaxID=1828758 RepID=A0A8J7CY22_DESMC|nr:DUF3110 domain-containing protein [Desmonostoc muscorum]MCF2152150.1 DUF3110 domain-containing protein [Desmonostoc muscorum LEGE 12446]